MSQSDYVFSKAARGLDEISKSAKTTAARRMGALFRKPPAEVPKVEFPSFAPGSSRWAPATDGRGKVADQVIANRGTAAQRRAASQAAADRAAEAEASRRAAAPKGRNGKIKVPVAPSAAPAAPVAPKPQSALDRVKAGYNYGLTYSAMHPYRAGAIAAGGTAATGTAVGGTLYATNRNRRAA